MKKLLLFALVLGALGVWSTGCGGDNNKVKAPTFENVPDDELPPPPPPPEMPE